MKLTLVTPPAALLASADVRAQLSLGTTTQFDTQLDGYIAAAVSLLDGPSGVLGRCMVDQVWAGKRTGWSREIPLGLPDVSAVVVGYLDTDGGAQTVDAANFEIVARAEGAVLVFRPDTVFPDLDPTAAEPVTLTITAGYGASADVPKALRQAVLMLVAHFFEHRGAVATGSELPLGPRALVAPFRMTGI